MLVHQFVKTNLDQWLRKCSMRSVSQGRQITDSVRQVQQACILIIKDLNHNGYAKRGLISCG